METFAQTTLVSIRDGGAQELRQLARYTARDLYLLLTYGRTEGGAGVFAKIYDQFLAPKLKGRTTLEAARYLGLRHFLSLTVVHERFSRFLRALGPEATQMAVLGRTIRGVHADAHPLEQAIAAAEVLDTVTEPGRLRSLSAILCAEYESAKATKDRALYGMLAVRLSRRMKNDAALSRIAEPYSAHVRETRTLAAGNELIVQRHLFWNDDDGVESFQSFRQVYSADPRWRFKEEGGVVHVTGKGSKRRIELFANVPADVFTPANRKNAAEIESRQDKVTRELAGRGLSPEVLVHRGHSYHLQKSLPYFTPSARLVYLGSCNGMDKMAAVTERASSAQIIATRGVGTMSINDPVLKAINDELLDSDQLDWPVLWGKLERELGGHEMFRDYIGPHRNAAASLLSAYYEIVGRD